MEYHYSKSSLACTAALVFLHGCTGAPTPMEKVSGSSAENEPEHHVQLPIITVKRTVVPQTIEFPGKVSALPDHSVSISPNIAGKITKVMIVPGQQVLKGQLIALLDDRQLRAQLQQATVPQRAAVNAVAQAKIALDLAQKNLARTEALFDKDIVAQKDVIAARSQEQLSKSQVEAAEAKVAEAEVAPAHIATQLAFTKVYSPLSGVVAQRFLNVGSAADPATPIAHIVNLNQVMINANMPADSPANPRVGQTATITTVAEPGVTYRGLIKSISPMVDPNNNTVSIELLATNDHGRLKEGQQVNVFIETLSTNAVLVPETAIVPGHDDPAEHFVYLVRDGKLKLQKVIVGSKRNNQVPVLQGLAEGDEVVQSGGYGVPDGATLDRGRVTK